MFKNLVENEYAKTTLIPALNLLFFYRFFVDTNFRKFFHFVNHPKNFPKVETDTWSHQMPKFLRIPD